MKKVLAAISLLMLVSCSSSEIDPKKSISDILYQDQIAWDTSTSDGWEFQLKHTYPGSIDIAEAETCISGNTNSSPYGVADMSTLREDPTWLPPKTSPDSIAFSSPPKGDTYLVTVSNDGQLRQLHFTILDGKTYFYPAFCS